jgi:hypothetical protein
MSILNPRRLAATLPSERIDNQPVVAENVYIEVGTTTGADWTVFADETSPAASREGTTAVFNLEALRPIIPVGVSIVGARAVEERPDLVTEDFPNGVDLYSTWAEGGEIVIANPPSAPTGLITE